jgi:ankyrin repeat protein/flagellar basal body-associated protein FliL
MNYIRFDCPACGQNIEAEEDAQFVQVKCPTCQHEFFPEKTRLVRPASDTPATPPPLLPKEATKPELPPIQEVVEPYEKPASAPPHKSATSNQSSKMKPKAKFVIISILILIGFAGLAYFLVVKNEQAKAEQIKAEQANRLNIINTDIDKIVARMNRVLNEPEGFAGHTKMQMDDDETRLKQVASSVKAEIDDIIIEIKANGYPHENILKEQTGIFYKAYESKVYSDKLFWSNYESDNASKRFADTERSQAAKAAADAISEVQSQKIDGSIEQAVVSRRDPLATEKLLSAAKYGSGDIETIKLLLENGANVKAKDVNGNTALAFASREGHSDAIRYLLDKGAEINLKDNDGTTALMMAAARGQMDAVKLLLDKGADITANNNTGMTALIMAAMSGETDAVKLLLDKGAEIKVKDNKGMAALMWAAELGQIETVKLLLDRGAEVNAKDDRGGTALIEAATTGNADVVKLLLARGADVNAVTAKGVTALDMAIDNAAIMRLLKQAGAK